MHRGTKQAGQAETSPSAPRRRVFIRWAEVPGLLAGVLRSEPSAQRRVLGARRGGRIGVALAAVALWLAAGSAEWVPFALLHVAATTALGFASRGALSWRETQRLALWAATLPLLGGALLRALLPAVLLPVLLGLAGGQFVLWRALKRGLR